MERTRQQVIGAAAALAVASVGGGLLLGDFARTDNFAYYKQPHASAYQAPGALAVAEAPPPAPVPAATPTPVARSVLVVPEPRYDARPDLEIASQDVDAPGDDIGWQEEPERDAAAED